MAKKPTTTYRLFLLILFVGLNAVSGQQCNWPTVLQNSVWEDSDKGTLTFTTVDVSGFDFTLTGGGTVVDNWNCFMNVDFTTHRTLIMQATVNVTFFGTVYQPYVCMELYQLTDYSYYYYILGVEEVRFDNDRLSVREANTAITTASALTELCINDTTGPTQNEYHFLLKSSSESLAAQTCPMAFQDEFWYSVYDGTTTTCNTQTEHWNVCSDTTRMLFNYTLCGTKIAYSNAGNVRCMMSLTVGTDLLTTVYNTDSTVDDSTTYRFTCFRSTKYSNDSMSVSQSPMSCTKDQTSTGIPTHTGTPAISGITLALHPYAISACDPTTTTTTTSTTTTTTPTTTTTTPTTTTTTPTTTTTTPTTTTTTPTTTTTTPTTTTTTPTTTTTTPTTTTTTPTTTTTTTPTTTTTTPTTTTTTPTTTTTTPTTTTTTPTTTTTTPTTTTTTPTTTTTTPTTTTTTPTTTTTTTTTATPVSSSASSDSTTTLIAIILGAVAACLTIALIVVFIVYRCCKKSRPVTPEPEKEPSPPPTPEPDPTIESMSHTMSGIAALTPRSLMGPRETTIVEPGLKRPNTSLFVFPDAKSNDFKLTMPSLRDSYMTSPAPSKVSRLDSDNQGSKRPAVARSSSMLGHRPSPIPEEGSGKLDDRKTQSLRTKMSFVRSDTLNGPWNVEVPNSFDNENRRSSIPRNSISPVPPVPWSTAGQTNTLSQSQHFETLSETMNQSVSKQLSDSLDAPDLNTSAVTVPESARPIVITSDTERRVNLKSRLAFTENDKPVDTENNLTQTRNETSPVMDTGDKVEQATSESHENTMLFKTLELNSKNASKEAEDVVLLNTPMSYDGSRKGSSKSARSEALDMTLSNGIIDGFDPDINRLSPITSTPRPAANQSNAVTETMKSVELI